MVQFFQTVMGKTFFQGTLPQLVRALTRIANSLEKQARLDELPVDIEKRAEAGVPKDRVLRLLVTDMSQDDRQRLRDTYCKDLRGKAENPLEVEEWDQIINFLTGTLPASEDS